MSTQLRSAGTLGVTLYQHLTSRSAFAETVAGTAVGAAISSGQVSLSTLPADSQGGVDLVLPVSSGDAASTATGPVGLDLRCAPGACGGVYPLRLQVSSTGGTRAQLFTYLVFADPPPSTQKLRFALVLPFTAPPSVADPSGHVRPIAPSTVARLDTVTSALSAHDMAVTLAPEPSALTSLAAAGRGRAHGVAAAVGALATAPGHETLAGSYVPVDASALMAAGLGGELGAQVRRAAQVLAPLRPTSGTWLSSAPLDQASLGALTSLGVDRVVVPPGAVSQAPGSSLTPTRPFSLTAGRGVTASAVVSDSALSAHLAAGSGPGDALAAYQLLADLALVYFEQPNLDTARGVVAVPPASWAPDASFLDTVFSALPADPLVAPVTLEQLFAEVPGATGSARHTVSPATSGTLPARQIRAARARLSAFSSAVGDSGLATARSLDDVLLAAEDTGLRSAQAQAAVTGARAALDRQLGLLSIRTDTIRLTSTAAKIPVTLVKQARYSVTGTLEIVGDKVVFPPAAAQDPGAVCRAPAVQVSAERSRFRCTATIGLPTNAVYVSMRARATGDFRLTVTLVSPSGGLVLASSQVTVRSMSTSLVAIGLSLAAVAVLLVWWGRTLWRARRRGAHARGAATRDG